MRKMFLVTYLACNERIFWGQDKICLVHLQSKIPITHLKTKPNNKV